jgi:hypothetical protein
MRVATTFLTAVSLFFGATRSEAVTLMINGDTPSVRFQGWADQSRVPTPDGLAILFLADCPTLPAGTVMGCTDDASIWISPSAAVVMRVALMHELGHVFDAQKLTDVTRERFRRIWRRPQLPWMGELAPLPQGAKPSGTAGDPSRAAEWFADAYQACALDRMPVKPDAVFALALIPVGQTARGERAAERRLTATCALIRRAGQ